MGGAKQTVGIRSREGDRAHGQCRTADSSPGTFQVGGAAVHPLQAIAPLDVLAVPCHIHVAGCTTKQVGTPKGRRRRHACTEQHTPTPA